MRLRLTVAYDGTGISGWQSQPNGNTVQDSLEMALARLCPGRTAVHGAGRTDAGVHADGQCAHADVPDGRLTPDAWMHAINAHMPAAIRTHDFAAFSAKRSKEPESTVRTIRSLRVVRRGQKITLTFEGDGFLYKMVRMLAGSAVRGAMGRLDFEELAARLREGAPRINLVAPACGLCLVRVIY